MRMKKSIISFITFFCLLCSTILLSSCNKNLEDKCVFKISKDEKSYELIKYDVAYKEHKVTIPNRYKGLPVTSIAKNCFWIESNLQSIHIPSNIKNIDTQAFYRCTNLESITVHKSNKYYDSRNNSNAIINSYSNTLILGCQNTTIPDTVTTIGAYAFQGCENLKSISIPEGVKQIDMHAFEECKKLSSITIPNSVTSISESLFENCTNLERVVIGDGLETIPANCFLNCSGLNTITIGKNVKRINSDAFGKCEYIKTIYYNNSLENWPLITFENMYSNPLTLSYTDKVFYTKNEDGKYVKSEGLTIPEGTTEIKNGAFMNNASIKEIIIPDSVITIQPNAFENCTNLEKVTFGKNSKLKTIFYNAFKGCSKLIDLELPESVEVIYNYAFENCTSLKTIYIPKNVKTILSQPFGGCTSLESIIVDNNNPYYNSKNSCNAIIETASNKLIAGCKNTIIPNDVQIIGYDAFRNCSTLESIVIPNSVSRIEDYAFMECSSLKSVTLPTNLSYLGEWAFGYSGITSINIPNSITVIK